MIDREYVKKLRKDKGLRQKDIADLLGVSEITYLRFEKRNRELRANELQKLAEILEVSMDELASGKPAQQEEQAEHGEDAAPKGTLPKDETGEIVEPSNAFPRRMLILPKFCKELAASCGTGNLHENNDFANDPPEQVAVPLSPVLSRYDPKSLFCWEVEGDSMEPQIHDGWTVVVYRTQDLVAGAMYLVKHGGCTYVKGIRFRGQIQVVLHSLNPGYSDIVVDPEDSFECIGRVVEIHPTPFVPKSF